MNSIYVTADLVGQESGGGHVTANEVAALRQLGGVTVIDRQILGQITNDPWEWDERALAIISGMDLREYRLCHLYAGTFSKTVDYLIKKHIRVGYTCAAHSVNESRKAHEELGLQYNYPHLTDPDLWRKYSAGYFDADVLVVPSTYSRRVVTEQWNALYPHDDYPKNGIDVRVIPHGCTIPDKVAPLPKTWTVGNLGSWGADKTVHVLLQAWKKLNYSDAVLLLAGKDSISPWARHLIEKYGGGAIQLMGWVDKVADFYVKISLYVQSSRTEGHGIEVVEAMAYSRPVICSDGAGAVDLCRLGGGSEFKAGDVDGLAGAIDWYKNNQAKVDGTTCRQVASEHTWDKVQEKYIQLWKELLKV